MGGDWNVRNPTLCIFNGAVGSIDTPYSKILDKKLSKTHEYFLKILFYCRTKPFCKWWEKKEKKKTASRISR